MTDPRAAWRGRRSLAPARGLHPARIETGPPPVRRQTAPQAPDPDEVGETLLPEPEEWALLGGEDT